MEPWVTAMSMSAWPSMRPARPRSAWRRAASTRRGRRVARNSRARNTIIRGPPRNSARVNCQPSRTAMMMPSSMTRLVEANWNAIAAVKLAPLRKIERAKATAAYEHDEEAAPRPVAMASEWGESSGSRRLISRLDTTACTAPDKAKPRMSAHRISQNMANARLRAWPSPPSKVLIATPPAARPASWCRPSPFPHLALAIGCQRPCLRRNLADGRRETFRLTWRLTEDACPDASVHVGQGGHHAGLLVVEVVAVHHPLARIVGSHVNGKLLHRPHDHSVLAGTGATGAAHLEAVAVQMHGVKHHRLVAKHQPHPLALADRQRLGVREGAPVDRPWRPAAHPARRDGRRRAAAHPGRSGPPPAPGRTCPRPAPPAGRRRRAGGQAHRSARPSQA